MQPTAPHLCPRSWLPPVQLAAVAALLLYLVSPIPYLGAFVELTAVPVSATLAFVALLALSLIAGRRGAAPQGPWANLALGLIITVLASMAYVAYVCVTFPDDF